MTLDDLIPIEADPKPLAVFAMPVLPDIPDATYWIIIYRATTEDTPQPSDIEALRGAVWLVIEQAKAMATEPQGIGELIDRVAEIISTASGSVPDEKKLYPIGTIFALAAIGSAE